MRSDIMELDRQGLRRFSFIFAAVISVLFGILMPVFIGRWLILPWVISIGFVFWGLLAPTTVRPFYKLWVRLGILLGKVTTPVILVVVYFVVFVPYRVVLQLLRKDLLCLKFDKAAKTYRVASAKLSSSHMERPF